MIEWLAIATVVAAGLFLVGLGLAALARPAAASRFLMGFASSARLHYLELSVRILVGLAFLQCAPRLRVPEVFLAFGGVLVVTSAALLLVPWRWHRRFAERSVPQALRFLPLMGLASVAMGGAVLGAVAFGNG